MTNSVRICCFVVEGAFVLILACNELQIKVKTTSQ